jgi:hypothetical protein
MAITKEVMATMKKCHRKCMDDIRTKTNVLAMHEDDQNHVTAPSPTQEAPETTAEKTRTGSTPAADEMVDIKLTYKPRRPN